MPLALAVLAQVHQTLVESAQRVIRRTYAIAKVLIRRKLYQVGERRQVA